MMTEIDCILAWNTNIVKNVTVWIMLKSSDHQKVKIMHWEELMNK